MMILRPWKAAGQLIARLRSWTCSIVCGGTSNARIEQSLTEHGLDTPSIDKGPLPVDLTEM